MVLQVRLRHAPGHAPHSHVTRHVARHAPPCWGVSRAGYCDVGCVGVACGGATLANRRDPEP
eukprot:1742840-Rhodomonas_salina.1